MSALAESSFCALGFALQCIPLKDSPLGHRMEVASTLRLTGPTGLGINRICFLTCVRSGNNGFWKSMSRPD